MSTTEMPIKSKQLEFYKDLSEQLQCENKRLQCENRRLQQSTDKAIDLIYSNVSPTWSIVDTAIIWKIEKILRGDVE